MNAQAMELIPEVLSLSKAAFKKIQTFFAENSGIVIAEHKQQLIVNRLRKHMQDLGFNEFETYCHYVATAATAAERTQVVDLLTTNETYFFREPEHFNQLGNLMLPTIKHRPLRIWCAAASSGEEPYSLAMALNEKLGNYGWELIASDISVRMLESAAQGLYRMQRLEFMPPQYLKKYCRKGVGAYEGSFLVAPEIRNKVKFVQHNLLDNAAGLGKFDIIFVRNVMIYFDADVKDQVLKNLLTQLKPGGWLVTSHSESLLGCGLALEQVKPSIYRHQTK
jgi:chemotaxis protein methyltransferase CheR